MYFTHKCNGGRDNTDLVWFLSSIVMWPKKDHPNNSVKQQEIGQHNAHNTKRNKPLQLAGLDWELEIKIVNETTAV